MKKEAVSLLEASGVSPDRIGKHFFASIFQVNSVTTVESHIGDVI